MKKVPGSTCKDPQNRSDKKCCCGGHSRKAKRPKYKDHNREKPKSCSCGEPYPEDIDDCLVYRCSCGRIFAALNFGPRPKTEEVKDDNK